MKTKSEIFKILDGAPRPNFGPGKCEYLIRPLVMAAEMVETGEWFPLIPPTVFATVCTIYRKKPLDGMYVEK